MGKTRTPAPRRRTKRGEQTDVAALFKMPVTVGKDGSQKRMQTFELALRAQVKKALKDGSVSAILAVIEIAKKYDLLEPPPEPFVRGGVLVVPGRLTKESWERLFKKPKQNNGPDDNSN